MGRLADCRVSIQNSGAYETRNLELKIIGVLCTFCGTGMSETGLSDRSRKLSMEDILYEQSQEPNSKGTGRFEWIVSLWRVAARSFTSLT